MKWIKQFGPCYNVDVFTVRKPLGQIPLRKMWLKNFTEDVVLSSDALMIQALYGVLLKSTCFLGGLNHLIGSRMRISYGSFGTLPIGILFSNLGSGQLMTCPRNLSGEIWHMSIFGDSGAVRVLMPKYRGLRKSIFSRWRSDDCSTRLGGFRWADGWAIWWYHFRRGPRHLRALAGLPIWRFRF